MASHLSDLDELVLRCRDAKARNYITEAVASYRAGAFRASIVSTWIAVCFDIIDKIRELALSGDKGAEIHVSSLENIQRKSDLPAALAFERKILVVAHEEFELLSNIERIDLERLQADRNRCAHPSLNIDEAAYMPPAELARAHIYSAVSHLLQHPPAQGKYALERVMQEINSEYFPKEVKAATRVFESGPLKRPRDSLTRNVTTILTKTFLLADIDTSQRQRLTAALGALKIMHFENYSAALKEKLPVIIRSVGDDKLAVIVDYLERIQDTWQYLPDDIRERIQNYTESLPSTLFESHMDFLLSYDPLHGHAKKRIKAATRDDLRDCLFFPMTPAAICNRLIDLYLQSYSFAEANDWAKQLFPHCVDFTPAQITRLIQGCGKNKQISGSNQISALILKLRSHKKDAVYDLEELLIANDLKEHALADL